MQVQREELFGNQKLLDQNKSYHYTREYNFFPCSSTARSVGHMCVMNTA